MSADDKEEKEVTEETKVVDLSGVTITQKGDEVIFSCPLGAKDETGKTPCDYIKEFVEKSKTLVTQNIKETVASELIEKAKKKVEEMKEKESEVK